MKHAIIHGDVVEVCTRIPEKSFDAVLCDPPYELGFMGKSWDSAGVSFNPKTWAVILRCCKPGAHLLAFGGSRTMHRITCAIEDGGWQIRDSLIWLYGSGFPKSLNLGNGYGTALKPAHEPIVLARAPLDGTVAANAAKYGCGALAIDACRIAHDEPEKKTVRTAPKFNGSHYAADAYSLNMSGGDNAGPSLLGRWPANVLLDEEAAAALDEHSGIRKSGIAVTRNGGGGKAFGGIAIDAGLKGLKGFANAARPDSGYSDSGGASRFFYTAKVGKKERNAGLDDMPELSAGEATDREDDTDGLNSPRAGAGRTGGNKNPHPTLKPIKLTEYLAKLILPPNGGRILIPFSGAGSEMIGAALAGWSEIVGVEQSAEYLAIANKRIAHHVR